MPSAIYSRTFNSGQERRCYSGLSYANCEEDIGAEENELFGIINHALSSLCGGEGGFKKIIKAHFYWLHCPLREGAMGS